MIAHLTGKLFASSTQCIILDANGIGYEIHVPLSTLYSLPEKGEQLALHIHTHVRNDALLLFGFNKKAEKDLFLMLISISGIGPKLALNILSGIGPYELLEAIAQGNAPDLQAIPGVGKKTAERIVLELKDRASNILEEQHSVLPKNLRKGQDNLFEDALSALLNLGYNSKSARQALKRAGQLLKDVTLEGLIRESLKLLV